MRRILSEQDKKEIKEALKNYYTGIYQILADKYKCSKSTIQVINYNLLVIHKPNIKTSLGVLR